MFAAPCCIYEALFKTVCNDFLATGSYAESVRDGRFFKNVDRGVPRHLTQSQSSKAYFPASYLEWGSISEIKPYQSPSGFIYGLVVPLNVLTYIGENNAVFTGNTSGLGYGIGDIVSLVTEKFWADNYAGRFMKARNVENTMERPKIPTLSIGPRSAIQEADDRRKLKAYSDALRRYEAFAPNTDGPSPVDEPDWWIVDFTLSVGQRVEPGPGGVGILTDSFLHGNPNIRGTTIYYNFQVFERDALLAFERNPPV